ncbi:ribonuclease P protein component [Microbulbifer harenosus]|uniref:Ribonuclease P protein component n=1 Tax=Microbulbifer harenosus TaxID=2576840 RepID=A0ABY2UIN0_9GAMM|nr:MULTISPECIES: ribonuclease P protein component [Microbulbifer]QIL90718.1 ribonuclease P protein component [Microbulbifer sp. SH-1]TLM75746.1 ribonuclease P protein component [Microbulbifer harenosus]
MQCPRSDFAFAKPLRLLNAAQYRAVFDSAPVRAAQPQFLILARPNDLGHPRLGLVIAKKHVRNATDRNRIKRIARETFRLQQHQLFPLDAVVLARAGAGELDKDALAKIFNKLWRKLDQRARNPQPDQGTQARPSRAPRGKGRKRPAKQDAGTPAPAQKPVPDSGSSS